MNESIPDVYGQALTDYYYQQSPAPLILYTNGNLEDPGEMPLPLFFRSPEAFPPQEQIALALCQGKVLDIGAGAGSHSLFLQEKGLDVTALEYSGMACEIMRERGVKKVLHQDIFTFEGKGYDTLLFLMNGIGLSEDIKGLKRLLSRVKEMLNPGGQLIFDSSDLALYYEGEEQEKPKDKYYGEIAFQYEYKNQKGRPFRWLYIDPFQLYTIVQELGWEMQILDQDDTLQYLVRLSLKD